MEKQDVYRSDFRKLEPILCPSCMEKAVKAEHTNLMLDFLKKRKKLIESLQDNGFTIKEIMRYTG